ncbi:MAG: ATP-binding cassette domain-containing protein [Candidatus Ancillula trichonymphae]|nr:ATP-binding cassette domain-containing protein [Candidatus Ancillula trichonymphae]
MRNVFLLHGNGGVYEELSIFENLKFQSLLFTGETVTRDQVESSEIFKKMGLMKYLDKPMQQLSSGLEKRVALVLGLYFAPSLVMLDEPTNSIDPNTREVLLKMLLSFRLEDKATIVVSHDLSFVHDTCDRVIILNDATIVLDKKMTDFTDVEELQKVYFVLTEEDDQSDC